MITESWPFADPPNIAVIANRKVVLDGEWISYVSHDIDDGGWQFHCNHTGDLTEADAAVVSLQEILSLDAMVAKLADLPVGWHAWRDSKAAAWQRAETMA